MNRLKHLNEERARLEGEMASIFAICEKENRSRTADEKKKWDDLKAQVNSMSDEIKDLEVQESLNQRNAKPVGKPAEHSNRPTSVSEDISIRGQIAKWMEDNKEVLEQSRRNAVPIPAIHLRAVATMTHAKVNAGGSVHLPNAGSIQGAVNDLNRVQPTFWNRLAKGRTSQNPYVWVNKTNKEGNAQFIAEGALKPLASFELATESSVPKKVAEAMKVSREVLFDIDGIASLIENELEYEVMIAANTAVLTGTASSTSPAGVTTLATAFTLTTIETATPTYLDAIRAAAAQLRSLGFDRDIVAFINPIDAANMDLAKGTDGHYMLPPFTSSNGQTISGITVIEDRNITVGNLLIGDMSKYKILMYQDFFVEWGWENDDFRKNLVTVIGEMRFHQFMGANDAGAFIYDAFADIQTAIAAA